jgi:hypothetical protein
MPENPPKHPKANSVQALEEALQSTIAAQLHHKTVAFLNAQLQGDPLTHYPVKLLLAHIEEWREHIAIKHTRLRELIGLTGGTHDTRPK